MSVDLFFTCELVLCSSYQKTPIRLISNYTFFLNFFLAMNDESHCCCGDDK